MECIRCRKQLTEYEEHGFWNRNPYSKLCIDCLLDKTPPEQRTSLKEQLEQSRELWEKRTREYKV